jgi:hypothetical protein
MDHYGIYLSGIPIWILLLVLAVLLFGCFKLVKLIVLGLRG